MRGFATFRLSAELAHCQECAMMYYDYISDGFDRLENGLADSEDTLSPHRYALLALNRDSGIICGCLEMMKYEYPSMRDEPQLCGVRIVFTKFKDLAIRVMRKLGVKDVNVRMRHFSCKFRELFTPGWLKNKCYTQNQRERVLDVAIRCAKNFLQSLADMLLQLKNKFVPDEMRPIKIGEYASKFVLMCDTKVGVVLMQDDDGEFKAFKISPKAKQAWRVVRELVSRPDGVAKLPQGALSNFRNTDASNNAKVNGLFELANYIHSTGEPGKYTMKPYRKRNYEH